MATKPIGEIIDGDGHVYESDAALYPFFDHEKYPVGTLQRHYLFPDFDGTRRIGQGGWEFGVEADGWEKFMDQLGLSSAVLYPTAALAFAFSRGGGGVGGASTNEWAADLARAYNDWLYHNFLDVSPRLKGVALLPVQDPAASARELNRTVSELGFVGGVLTTPGLPIPYGDSAFDPLYEEAQTLGTMLAIHGAARRGLGFDALHGDTSGLSVLAHPFGQMIQFTSMISTGVFVRFPQLKVAFLEAGCGWVPFAIERIDRTPPERRKWPSAAEQVRTAPIYFHAELEEENGLPYAISVLGDDRLLYASDYPHEPDAGIAETLDNFLAREDIAETSKQRILCDNIKAIYSFS